MIAFRASRCSSADRTGTAEPTASAIPAASMKSPPAMSMATNGKSTIRCHSGRSPPVLTTTAMRPPSAGATNGAIVVSSSELEAETGLRIGAFGREQFLLPLDPAAVAAERAVAADHAVARDQHRDVIVAVRRPDRAHRFGLADGGRDPRVASGLARDRKSVV